MFPHRFNLGYAARARTVNQVLVIYSEGDSFTSGTAIPVPYNWRTDNPRASILTSVRHCSGAAIVEAALTKPRSLYKWNQASASAAGEPLQHNIVWSTVVPIVGPASFLVFVSATGTAATYTFGLDWAEVPTTSVI